MTNRRLSNRRGLRWGPAALLLVLLAPGLLLADDFDWNNIVVSGGTYSFVGPVQNQGSGDTCWAFATIGCLESSYMITRDDPTFFPNLSAQMLVDVGSLGTAAGGTTNPALAMNFVVGTGVAPAAMCPYTATDPSSPWTMPSSWQGLLCKASSAVNGFTASTATIKADLKMYGPMTATLFADNDFYPPGSRVDLGHELLVTGYHDATASDPPAVQAAGGYWIVENEWGTGWGTNGYGEVLYGTLGVDADHVMYALSGPTYFVGATGSATWSGGTAWSASAGNASWTIASSLGVSQSGPPTAWVNGETEAVFNTALTGTIALDNNISAHGLTILPGATDYTFTGGSLILTASGIAANESVTINSPVTVGAPQTWTAAAGKQILIGGTVDLNVSPLTIAGSGNTVINGVISDVRNDPVLGGVWTGPTGTLTQAGPGTLTLGGANLYSGNTLIAGGTLLLANPLALQFSTFDTSGTGALSFGGLTSAAFGGLQGPGNLALTNANAAAVALTVGENGATTSYSGNLSGGGASLVKTGTGVLILAGTNAYSGGTTVNAGVLQIKTANALPGGTMSGYAVASGATVSFNVGGRASSPGSAIERGAGQRRDVGRRGGPRIRHQRRLRPVHLLQQHRRRFRQREQVRSRRARPRQHAELLWRIDQLQRRRDRHLFADQPRKQPRAELQRRRHPLPSGLRSVENIR